ncbi:MAG: DUF4476 domain-containing protein [Bacteroidetes bacterium]|nr:DUF4476 domain-containing protein [Bacteroidota bacterium]
MNSLARYFMVIFLITISLSSIAQFGTVVVFAPKGEKFTLFFGSKSKNAEPSARVEADNPGGPSFKIKVVFPDASVKELSKMVFNRPGATMYYKVEKNAKGVFTLESTSSEWMDEVKTTGQENPTPPPAGSGSTDKKETKPEEPAKAETGKSAKAAGCDHPMSDPDFTGQLVDISARPFEPMQLSAAKKMTETHCLTVSQVVLVIHVFDTESSRLSFAKFAYDHTYDRDNYSDVKDALHSDKSRTELDRYISEKSK